MLNIKNKNSELQFVISECLAEGLLTQIYKLKANRILYLLGKRHLQASAIFKDCNSNDADHNMCSVRS